MSHDEMTRTIGGMTEEEREARKGSTERAVADAHARLEAAKAAEEGKRERLAKEALKTMDPGEGPTPPRPPEVSPSVLAAEPRIVRDGDVLPTLFNEIGRVVRRLREADAFERRVVESAKSPAAWLALRAELTGSDR